MDTRNEAKFYIFREGLAMNETAEHLADGYGRTNSINKGNMASCTIVISIFCTGLCG